MTEADGFLLMTSSVPAVDGDSTEEHVHLQRGEVKCQHTRTNHQK